MRKKLVCREQKKVGEHCLINFIRYLIAKVVDCSLIYSHEWPTSIRKLIGYLPRRLKKEQDLRGSMYLRAIWKRSTWKWTNRYFPLFQKSSTKVKTLLVWWNARTLFILKVEFVSKIELSKEASYEVIWNIEFSNEWIVCMAGTSFQHRIHLKCNRSYLRRNTFAKELSRPLSHPVLKISLKQTASNNKPVLQKSLKITSRLFNI